MNDDPFSVDADPGLTTLMTRGAHPLHVDRRGAARLLILGTLAVTGGCAHSPARIACNVKREDPSSCQHRFCRHHRP